MMALGNLFGRKKNLERLYGGTRKITYEITNKLRRVASHGWFCVFARQHEKLAALRDMRGMVAPIHLLGPAAKHHRRPLCAEDRKKIPPLDLVPRTPKAHGEPCRADAIHWTRSVLEVWDDPLDAWGMSSAEQPRSGVAIAILCIDLFEICVNNQDANNSKKDDYAGNQKV